MDSNSITAIGGSTSATLATRFGHMLNVVDDFGADPFGARDSATAINNAVHALSTTGGGLLYYPPGTYKVDSTISDVEKVYHVGAGPLATTVRANADIPVFTRAGSDSVTINGGGIIGMSIRGYWNQNPSQRTNSYGIRSSGANRAIYRDLRFFSCYVGMYAAFDWQTRWDFLSADGDGTDQNYYGFYMDETSGTQVDNAVIAVGCHAQDCKQVGFRLINCNGSKFDSCESSGSEIGFFIGDPPTGFQAVQFGHFVNCLSDTNGTNWQLVRGRASLLNYFQFANCWSGTAKSGHGWSIMNGSAIILSNCNSDSLAQCGIQLDTCTHIQVSGMRITAANTSNGGYSGINLINSTHCTITSCDIAASHGMRSVDENGSSDYNLVQGNQLYVGCQVLGAHSRFRLNLGVNENM